MQASSRSSCLCSSVRQASKMCLGHNQGKAGGGRITTLLQAHPNAAPFSIEMAWRGERLPPFHYFLFAPSPEARTVLTAG